MTDLLPLFGLAAGLTGVIALLVFGVFVLLEEIGNRVWGKVKR